MERKQLPPNAQNWTSKESGQAPVENEVSLEEKKRKLAQLILAAQNEVREASTTMSSLTKQS